MDKETEKMFEIVHQNHLKETRQVKQVKKVKKESKLLFAIQIIIAIAIICVLFYVISLIDNSFVKKCVNAGYDENYCLYQIAR